MSERTEPMFAGDVKIGDLLVHDQAESGYLMVTDVQNIGAVSLRFETGESKTYNVDQKLYRVVEPEREVDR